MSDQKIRSWWAIKTFNHDDQLRQLIKTIDQNNWLWLWSHSIEMIDWGNRSTWSIKTIDCDNQLRWLTEMIDQIIDSSTIAWLNIMTFNNNCIALIQEVAMHDCKQLQFINMSCWQGVSKVKHSTINQIGFYCKSCYMLHDNTVGKIMFCPIQQSPGKEKSWKLAICQQQKLQAYP